MFFPFPLKKKFFSIYKLLSIEDSIWVRDVGACTLFFWGLGASCRHVQVLCLLYQSLWVHMSVSPVISWRPYCPLFPLTFTLFQAPLVKSSLSPEGGNLIAASLVGTECSKVSDFWRYYLAVGLFLIPSTSGEDNGWARNEVMIIAEGH